MIRKQRLALRGILLTGLAGLATGFIMLGQPATLAHILTFFLRAWDVGPLVAFRKNMLDRCEPE